MTKYNNLVSHLYYASEQHPDVIALVDEHSNPPIRMTYHQVCVEADHLAICFLRLGIKRGDRVALFADNQPLWRLTDYALLSIGAISVPRGTDSAIAELWYIIQHSEARIAILQDVSLAKQLFDAGHSDSLEGLIILQSNTKNYDISQINLGACKLYFYDDIKLTSTDTYAEIDMNIMREEASKDDIATIVYTSGTTGIPKGVMLTHWNLSSQLLYLDAGLRNDYPPGLLQLAMLPAWHAYERIAEYFLTYQVAPTLYYTNKRHLKRDIAEVKPAIIPCVPRIWEMIFDNIRSQVQKQSPLKQRMFKFFVHVGKRYVYSRRKAFNLELRKTKRHYTSRFIQFIFMVLLYLPYRLADLLVFRKIRNNIAGKLIAAISGGGSLSPYIDDFFEMVGIVLLNGYGLSETSPVISVRSLKHNVRGSVGRIAEMSEVEIRSDEGTPLPQGNSGQIWVKGPQVMRGYYKNDTETKKVLVDGWFNTGDLGWISCTGDLVISGRAKDTIVLSSGENIEPEPIEGMLRESPLITDLVVIGQDKKFLSALVIPDIAHLAESLNLPPETQPHEIVSNSLAVQLVKKEIANLMKEHGGFKAHEMIQRIILLDEPFSEVNGLLTQTLKPKRNPISKRYSAEIEELYSN